MNHNNPTPLVPAHGKKLCPICGKPSYSRAGVHPQCSVQQADAPRQEQLKAERKRLTIAKQAAPQKSRDKQCPHCQAQVHIRQQVCVCGHHFGGA